MPVMKGVSARDERLSTGNIISDTVTVLHADGQHYICGEHNMMHRVLTSLCRTPQLM